MSAGPKTYGLKSNSGRKDVVKAKGFSLHYANQQIFHFESLKEQVLLKSLSEDVGVLDEEHSSKKRKLTLHNNEIIMRRKQFDIAVENNRGKSLSLCYDKRKILNPLLPYDRVRTVDTLPFGHKDLGVYTMRADMIDVMNDSESDTDF